MISPYEKNYEDSLLAIFPWLEALKGKLHNEKHHPEGDAFQHTISCLKNQRFIGHDPNRDFKIFAAIANHDYGKAFTYKWIEGKGHTYYGHDAVGAIKLKEVMPKYGFSNELIEICAFVCEKHMLMHPKPIKQLRQSKLASFVNNHYWYALREVAYCDEMSRLHLSNKKEVIENLVWAEKQAQEYNFAEYQKQVKKTHWDLFKERI